MKCHFISLTSCFRGKDSVRSRASGVRHRVVVTALSCDITSNICLFPDRREVTHHELCFWCCRINRKDGRKLLKRARSERRTPLAAVCVSFFPHFCLRPHQWIKKFIYITNKIGTVNAICLRPRRDSTQHCVVST